MTASSQLSPDYSPADAALSSSSAWCPQKNFTDNEYLQVRGVFLVSGRVLTVFVNTAFFREFCDNYSRIGQFWYYKILVVITCGSNGNETEACINNFFWYIPISSGNITLYHQHTTLLREEIILYTKWLLT